MRLINTQTLEIHDFVDHDHALSYVILSHTWGEDEVSYKDFTKGRNRDGAGCKKIVESCAFARSRNQEWVWIDTCCIDKRSSAEVSEVINSMFKWYEGASECYAYLADAASADAKYQPEFRQSRWFSRAWTLQELIAPSLVIFLSCVWKSSLRNLPCARTLHRCLRDPEGLFKVSRI